MDVSQQYAFVLWYLLLFYSCLLCWNIANFLARFFLHYFKHFIDYANFDYKVNVM